MALTMRQAVEVVRMAKRGQPPSKLIHCTACDRVLGMYCADGVAIVHRGREILAEHVIAIRCECGAIWKPKLDSEQSLGVD